MGSLGEICGARSMMTDARSPTLPSKRGADKTPRWYLLLPVAIVLACAGLAQTQPGHAALRAAGLYEEPATYAELAFSTPSALPSMLTKSGASVKVSFGIHNVSADARSYKWSIVLVRAGVSQVKVSGAALTPPQGRTTITRSVVAACADGRVRVVVRLASPAESISFWMTCPPAAAKTKVAR